MLTGVHTPEEGEIFVDGQKVVFHNPVQSREAGIACVYQELNIVKQLSVTDNVFMGRAVKKNGLLDYPRMYEEAKQALTTLGHPEIDVKMECGKLGTGQQQMVETKVVIRIALFLSLARLAMAPSARLQILAEAMAEPSTSTRAICMEKASRPQKPSELPHAASTLMGPMPVANMAAT